MREGGGGGVHGLFGSVVDGDRGGGADGAEVGGGGRGNGQGGNVAASVVWERLGVVGFPRVWILDGSLGEGFQIRASPGAGGGWDVGGACGFSTQWTGGWEGREGGAGARWLMMPTQR
jgi:hypothetical protein